MNEVSSSRKQLLWFKKGLMVNYRRITRGKSWPTLLLSSCHPSPTVLWFPSQMLPNHPPYIFFPGLNVRFLHVICFSFAEWNAAIVEGKKGTDFYDYSTGPTYSTRACWLDLWGLRLYSSIFFWKKSAIMTSLCSQYTLFVSGALVIALSHKHLELHFSYF